MSVMLSAAKHLALSAANEVEIPRRSLPEQRRRESRRTVKTLSVTCKALG